MSDGTGGDEALRAFADGHPEPLLTLDQAGVVSYANPAAGELLGPPSGAPEAVEGRQGETVLTVPSDRGEADDDTGGTLLGRLAAATPSADDAPATDDGRSPGTASVRLRGRAVEGGAMALRARVRATGEGAFALTLRAAPSTSIAGSPSEEAVDRAREASAAGGDSPVASTSEGPGTATGIRGTDGETANWVALLRAFETAADGIAILDSAECYRYLNEAHADLYGVEDPTALLGEHWSGLYAAGEADRIRTEAMAALRTDGEWRGEATGRRVDGECFHQELTLSALPDGGLVCVVRDVSDQHRYERSLETLREATRELMTATDREAVADVAVQAAARALDLPLSAVFLHDESRGVLEPAAATDAAVETFAEIPTFTGESDSLVWRAFETGETQRYENPDTAERLYNESTPASAELIVPLEAHGVLLTGYVESTGFDEEQIRLFHTLAATVITALDRVQNAERLRERTEQLEQFSDALSHDLRNPLNTARATLALARTSADGETSEYLDQLEDIHRRMASLIEDVLALAAGPSDPDTSTIDLAALATESWDTVSADRTAATLELDPLGDVTAAPGQLRRLLENLFANALDHAGSAVTVTVGRLPPSPDAPGGFYVADDGPGIPPGDREQVFERGYTGDDGTGLGLNIVTRAARAHDWSVAVAESEAGGARFEIRGPDPGPPASTNPSV